jgi:alpha-glucoside transport system permease protein
VTRAGAPRGARAAIPVRADRATADTEESSVLYQLVGVRGESWHLLTAGAFLTMIVPVIVFLALQRYFVRGILAGSVKG